MIAPKLVRRASKLGWLDFLLSGTASAAVGYSAGMGLALPRIGWIFVCLIALGTLFSVAVHHVARPQRMGAFAGIPYAISLIAAVFFTAELNKLLPGDGFPLELILGGVLCWMLVFGSFTAWRDGSLLFQVVPGIAMFGMVGTWDTYKEAPITFFGFLLCVAALFARAHARAMLEQAGAAGYFDGSSEVDERAFRRIQAGPWRWMAGPEWALASAAAVILISLLGAPVLQESVKGVASMVQLNVPRPRTSSSSQSFPSSRPGSVDVGRGPLNLGTQVVLRARLDEPRYLRGQIFERYTGRGWATEARPFSSQGSAAAVAEIAQPRRIGFVIELVAGKHSSVPSPGVVTTISGIRRMRIRQDGTVELAAPLSLTPELQGSAVVPMNESSIPSDARAGLPITEFGAAFLDRGNVPARVLEYTQEVVKDAGSDYEKALAIKRAIEARCTYNLHAEAVPSDADAVETFLFDQPEGYCDLFASAMAMMARSAGIPARYVIGYYPFASGLDEEGRYEVRESDAHAWTELYFQDVGWVVFDATEGAAVAEGSGRGDAIAAPWYANPYAIGTLVLVLGGAGLAWSLSRRAVEAGPRGAVAVQYGRFLHAVERATRKPRIPSQTPRDYLATLSAKLGSLASEAERIHLLLERAMFGRNEPAEEALKEIVAAVGGFSRELRQAEGSPAA